MALYNDASNFTPSNDPLFGRVFEPGQLLPKGGMCRCTGCNKEIAIAQYHALPPQNHHQHLYSKLPIRWKLITFHN